MTFMAPSCSLRSSCSRSSAKRRSGAVRSVVDNEILVRKIQFPRMVIPLSVVLLAFFNLCLNLVVVMIFALIAGVRPMLSWLEVPPIVAMLVILCTGIAMLLSALFVYFRDIQPIWEVLVQVIFYASPIIIPIDLVQQHLSAALVHVYMLNPLAVIFQQFRHAFINHATPGAAAVLGSKAALLIPIADRRGDLRLRLLCVQPDRAPSGRGPLAPARTWNRTGGWLDPTRPGDVEQEALQRLDAGAPVVG